MTTLNEILAERGRDYGSFCEVAATAQALKNLAVSEHMNNSQREAMEMICSKIARLACGDPDHIDSWRDVAGYATLMVLELDGVRPTVV
jgi:hypothetical protein